MSRLILPRRALLKAGAAGLITSPAIIRKVAAQVGQQPGWPPIMPAPAPAGGSVWDSSNKGTHVTLSTTTLANDTATSNVAVGAWSSVKAVQGRSTGLHYLEMKFVVGSTSNLVVGLSDATTPGGTGLDTFCGAYLNSTGNVEVNGANISDGTGWAGASIAAWGSLVNNDIIQLAVDSTGANSPGNTIAFVGKNNTWLGSANPVTGANPLFTITGTPTVFPTISLLVNTDGSMIIITAGSFTFTPPTGYSAWG